MKMLLCLLTGSALTLLLGSCVDGQSIHVGSCPNPNVKDNFDFQKFSGRWYEEEKTFALFEEGIRCITTEIMPKENGEADFNRRGVSVVNNNLTLSRGKLKASHGSNMARMDLRLNGVLFPLKYRVLETDYDTYAVVWSCLEFPGLGGRLGHIEYLRLLSRFPTMNEILKKAAYGSIDGNGLDRSYVRKSANQRCPDIMPTADVDSVKNGTDSVTNVTDSGNNASVSDSINNNENATGSVNNIIDENSNATFYNSSIVDYDNDSAFNTTEIEATETNDLEQQGKPEEEVVPAHSPPPSPTVATTKTPGPSYGLLSFLLGSSTTEEPGTTTESFDIDPLTLFLVNL